MQVHNFRINGEKHMVMCTHRKVKRNGSHVTLCALYVTEDARRLTDRAMSNCFKCNRAFDGFIEAIDTDFSYEPVDRFA